MIRRRSRRRFATSPPVRPTAPRARRRGDPVPPAPTARPDEQRNCTRRYCPEGTLLPQVCPDGYYRPTPSVAVLCPRGHFCRPGALEPRPAFFSPCPEGTQSDGTHSRRPPSRSDPRSRRRLSSSAAAAAAEGAPPRRPPGSTPPPPPWCLPPPSPPPPPPPRRVASTSPSNVWQYDWRTARSCECSGQSAALQSPPSWVLAAAARRPSSRLSPAARALTAACSSTGSSTTMACGVRRRVRSALEDVMYRNLTVGENVAVGDAAPRAAARGG